MSDPHMIISCTRDAEPFAFTVIDSLTRLTSSGGVRIYEDVDLDEVKLLAREMSLKFSFIGLPRGGAKSGLRIPAGASSVEKLALCEEFGRRLAPVIHAGLYYPGMDMNCGPNELRAIYRGAGLELGTITDSSFFTAISVAAAMQAVRKYLQAERPLNVAIEGFGSVAAHLANRLPEDQFRIVAFSTREGGVYCREGFAATKLLSLRKLHGDGLVHHVPGETIDPDAVLAADVDIFVPAARVQSLNDSTAGSIKANAVVPVANAPYTCCSLEELCARSVVCLPGFVSNSGGVFASGLFDSGVPAPLVEQVVVDHFQPVVAALLEVAGKGTVTPVALAERIALRRLQERSAAVLRTDTGESILRRLVRMGLAPKRFVAQRALRFFVKNMQTLAQEIGDGQ